ncbi:hypothetical protein [Arthrobacter citreus]|uniref:hypothetical protein n=1 Tax=Arthrobacter citreus TaxID=1670 RepID=UPI0036D94E02
MFVLTIDQKDSRNTSDRVPGLIELLGSEELELPFERTVGDEVQGVASSPSVAVNAALLAIRQGGWSVGIGVGTVGLPLPASSREAGGEAFIAARAAAERFIIGTLASMLWAVGIAVAVRVALLHG